MGRLLTKGDILWSVNGELKMANSQDVLGLKRKLKEAKEAFQEAK